MDVNGKYMENIMWMENIWKYHADVVEANLLSRGDIQGLNWGIVVTNLSNIHEQHENAKASMVSRSAYESDIPIENKVFNFHGRYWQMLPDVLESICVGRAERDAIEKKFKEDRRRYWSVDGDISIMVVFAELRIGRWDI